MEHGFADMGKKLGFGVMRLPKIGEDVDYDTTRDMIDAFMANGFCYFDTARSYLQGDSERIVGKYIAGRYPRDSFILTNKLTDSCFQTEEEIRPLFEDQLKVCGVEYFDFYLMHALNGKLHEKYTAARAYDIAQELKAEGKIRHVGFSFHDTADVLDKILTDRPEMEVVQLQLNYLDWEDWDVQARACYEVCVKHGKPVLVMEPVKGGSLANVPEGAKALMSASPASYAIRFAAMQENVIMVLSGMSSMEQMADNMAFMSDFKPLDQGEMAIVDRTRKMIQELKRIPCTACRYCVDGCPAGIDIPAAFSLFNDLDRAAYAELGAKAGDCVGCGACEKICPQRLEIRELLKKVAKKMEKATV